MGKRKAFNILILFTLLMLPMHHGAAAVKWDKWEQAINIPYDKVWTIQFNTPMNKETITTDNIYVINNKTLEKHPIQLQLAENQKSVKIIPEKDYEVDEQYTLFVKQDVQSAYGEAMVQSIQMPFIASRYFQLANLQDEEGQYQLLDSYDDFCVAVHAAKDDGSQVILKNGEVHWMPEGLVRSKGFTIIYDDPWFEEGRTYVNGETEMEYIASEGDAIKVRVADYIGYVEPEKVSLVPEPLNEGRSYYVNKNGHLYHYIFRNGIYIPYVYGPAPLWLEEGQKVYSWNGVTFNGEPHFDLYNQLDLKTKTHYTAEQLDNYIKSKKPDSPLIGLGKTFIEAQEKYGVNALYLMAHAIHESGWGLSKIAREKNNLYGINATDDNPYGNADEYPTKRDSIMYAAKFVSEKYLSPGNFRYNGRYLGNKASGMNVKYASDPYWGQKIAGLMYRADSFLGGNDRRLLASNNAFKTLLAQNEIVLLSATTKDESDQMCPQ